MKYCLGSQKREVSDTKETDFAPEVSVLVSREQKLFSPTNTSNFESWVTGCAQLEHLHLHA